MRLPFRKHILIFASVLMCGSVAFAQTEREKGLELYEKGDYKGAATILKQAVSRNGKDVAAWHYLGLSLEKDGNAKEAIKIYESNVDDVLKLIAEKIEDRLGGNARPLGEKETVRGFVRIQFSDEIETALASGKRFEEINAKKASSDKWQNKILSLRCFDKNRETETKDEETSPANTTPVKIIKKPAPGYTDLARRENVSGSVRLWVLFLSNGSIGLVVPLRRLPDNLTESSISAAKKIMFTPATKDGNPISVSKQIEYTFSFF